MLLKTIPIKLVESYMLTPKVKHFVFKTVNDEIPFNYIPGQFITVQFKIADKILRRSYSIANVPGKNNIIEFAAGFVNDGPGTNLLFNLKPNDTIDIAGPFGRLILRDDESKRYIFVATSTGITPYRSMLEQIVKRLNDNSELEVIIIHGVQNKNELLYANDFKTIADAYPNVKFYSCFSRQQDIKEFEHFGYVQTLLKKINLNPDEDIVYLCGNPGMIDETFEYLKDQNFSPQRVIREKYISGK